MYQTFPKRYYIFKDITPLLQNPKGLREILLKRYRIIIKIRKLMLSSALRHAVLSWLPLLPLTLAQALFPSGNPKLPYEKISMSYALEYGTDTLEIIRTVSGKGNKCLW